VSARDYSRGYGRALRRCGNRVQKALDIARGYRDRVTSTQDQRCDTCVRWTRGGPRCLWGACRGDFEYSAGEPGMWADRFVGEADQRRVITHENFGCVNWLPLKPEP